MKYITKGSHLASQSIIEPGVRMVAIINKHGRLEHMIGTDSIVMSRDRRDMYFMKIALRNCMQKDFDDYLGAVNYCMTQRADSKYISFPIRDGNTILAVTSKEIDHEKLVKEIQQMLNL